MDISQALKKNTMGWFPYGKEPKPFNDISQASKENTMGELPYGKEPKPFKDISQAPKENTMGELPYGKEPKPFKGFAWKQVPKKGEKKPKLFKENAESTEGELPHGQKPKSAKENVKRPRPELHRRLQLVKRILVVKHTI